jgi:glycosyltransferase involved in cell wall biosynthesis
MLSDSLKRRGHRVVLLCKKEQAMLGEAAQRGIETRTPGLSGKFNPLVALGILRIAREYGADLIHTHLSTASQWGSVAGRLGGIPVVSHVHAMNSRYFFMLSDAMVACSEGVRQHIIGQGVSRDRIETIYNGIESKRLNFDGNAAELRSSLLMAPDTPAIACIAHLADKKGQADLVRAVALLQGKWPDLRCFFVGTGENMDSLSRQAAQAGVEKRAILLGYRKDAVAIMNAMDCILLPSLGKEGLPLVLLEAALLGKPAICSNIPGNNEVVLDGITGLLFPPGDAAALADRIDRLLSDCELRRRMGNAARERAEREFTIEAMTDRVEGLYRRLIK